MVLAWIFKSFESLKKFYFLFHFIYWFLSNIKEFMSLSRTDLFLLNMTLCFSQNNIVFNTFKNLAFNKDFIIF